MKDYNEKIKHLEKILFNQQYQRDRDIKFYDRIFDLKEGDVIVDGGTWNGMSILHFLPAITETGHVYSYEASPYLHKTARIKFRKFDNVTIKHKALWSSIGEIELFVDSRCVNSNSVMRDFIDIQSDRSITVETTTLDEDLKYIERLDAIKFNIEGAEIEALKGAKNILKKHSPQLIVDAHKINGAFCSEGIKDVLQDYGYNTYFDDYKMAYYATKDEIDERKTRDLYNERYRYEEKITGRKYEGYVWK